MNFNWIYHNKADKKLKKLSVELEYQLRPKITRYLMARLDSECCGDFTCFYFDVDMTTQWVKIADKTPVEYVELIAKDFDKEINNVQRHVTIE